MLNRIGMLTEIRRNGMTRFVISTKLIIVGRTHIFLFLRTENQLHIRFFDIVHTYEGFISFCRMKSCFVHKVCKLSAGKSNSRLRNLS